MLFYRASNGVFEDASANILRGYGNYGKVLIRIIEIILLPLESLALFVFGFNVMFDFSCRYSAADLEWNCI